MTQRIPRRSPLFAAIHSALRPSTATAAVVGFALATAGPVQAAIENGAPGKAVLRPENLAVRDEVLFVDAQVADPRRLLVGAKQGVETVILEEGRDAVEQITAVLESRRPVAVHLVAHGESGRLRLGDTWLDARQLDANLALIRRWFAGADGAATPDLLLYACNLAEGAEGVAFVEKLAELSGADVAASDDVTGHSDLQGDWDLEIETGDIEAELAFSEITVNEYKSTLATFTVNTTNDNYASTEECDAEYCTLRDAIYEADANNNDPTVDVINFDLGGAKGLSTIDIENDFDISEPVTIMGPGITELTIDAEDEDRIFDINLASPTTITDMRLQEGSIGEYGGCIESTETDLTLDEVYFYSCYASEQGGAVYFESEGDDLYIRNSIFNENETDYDGGAVAWGGGEGDGGTLLIENSDFDENYAEEEGGAVWVDANESTVTIRDSDFTNNEIEDDEGGAVFFRDEEGSTVLVTGSYFYNNEAEEEGGGIFFEPDNTEITIEDSDFLENDAEYDGGATGFEDSSEGAEASDVLVENSYFYGNDANYGEGGAINFDTYAGNSLTVQYSQFVENETYSDEDGVGGALAAYNESDTSDLGDVTIRNSWFGYNEAEGYGNPDGGGASFYDLESVTIYASTFSGNFAESDGGGIQVERNESVTIVNSTFSGNEAGPTNRGGAMELDGNESLSIRNTTIAFNEALRGGGIHSYASEGSDTTVYLVNTIVTDNTAEEGPDLHGLSYSGADAYFDAFFSLVQDTTDIGPQGALIDEGGNVFGYSALLEPLDDSLGPTPVHVPGGASQAREAGDPAFVAPPELDQRKAQRVLGRLDIGSVEQGEFEIPVLSRWGLALMGLLMGALSLIGFRARKRDGKEA